MADIHATAGALMGVVRECFYTPDGKAPDGYHDSRDMQILRHWLAKGGDPERIEAAIRGTALLRDRGATYLEPGEKLTLRCLNPKEARYGRHLFQSGADAWEAHERDRIRRQGKPLGMAMPSQDELVAKLARAMEEARNVA